MARALVQAPESRVGLERRASVQETNVQAPAQVEGAGAGTGWVAVEPQVLLGSKTK